MEDKTGDVRLVDGQRKRVPAIEPFPIHQTAALSPPRAIEVKKKRWWQFWR
ncbi:MAG: hypothetical protein KBA97_02150 [Methanothrix sp.]|nr:hypothetical protein [Methanothrix sp.]